MPFSFIIWIINFLFHYYIYFFTANYTYVKYLLIISLKKPLTSDETNSLLFTRKPEDLTFQLSAFAKENGYSDSDLNSIIKTWARITPIQCSFILCWSYITYYFFYDKIIMATFTGVYLNVLFIILVHYMLLPVIRGL